MTLAPLAQQRILESVDTRFSQLERSRPHSAYGVVATVDTGNRLATVYVSGESVATVGFKYPALMPMAVGDKVRVVIDPRGDQYIDQNYTSLIGATQLGTNSVGSDEIASNAVGSDEIASGAVATEMAASTPGMRINAPTGHTIPSGGSTLGALEIYNPSTTTGDAYLTFHNPNRYAAHLGLDGATSDLFWGGWSAGTKKRVHHDGNHQPNSVRYVSLGTSPYIHWNAVSVTGAGDGDNTLTGITSAGTVAVAGYLRVNSNTTNAGFSAVSAPGAATDLTKVSGAAFAQAASKSIGSGFVCPTSGNVIRVYYDPQGGTLTLWLTITGYWTTAL